MGVRRNKNGDDVFDASDDAIRWLESITGFLAHVRAEYGSVSDMVQGPNWDASRNDYALALLKGLGKEIADFTTEFKDHA